MPYRVKITTRSGLEHHWPDKDAEPELFASKGAAEDVMALIERMNTSLSDKLERPGPIASVELDWVRGERRNARHGAR